MHPRFVFQPSVCINPRKFKSGRFNTGFFTFTFFQKFYWGILVAALALYYPIKLWSEAICGKYGYYGEGWIPQNILVMNRVISVSSQAVLTTWFVLCVLLLSMKLKVGNKFINFMGTITLEFYLIHGLFVELFGWQFDGGVRSPYHPKYVIVYVLLVFALGLPSAVLLKKFHTFVLGLGKKKESNTEIKAKTA